MSRSYKKHPYCTDGRSPTPRQMKSIANRSVRRHNKLVVDGWFAEDTRYENCFTLDGKSYKKWFCSYDIHDYINRWTKAQAIHEWEHPHWHYWARTDTWWHAWDDYKTREDMEQYWAKYYRRK